jgi:hypothetical protein
MPWRYHPRAPRRAARLRDPRERAGPTDRAQPWRAIRAVALWLDDHGTVGLFERLDALKVAYQEERVYLEAGDLTALVIRALCRYAVMPLVPIM